MGDEWDMIIKHNTLFRLFAYGKNRSRCQIRMRVSFFGTRLDFSTGCRIRTPEEWDSAGECVKRDVKGALAANEILHRCRDTMELVFRYYEVNEIIPSVREVTESYKARIAGQSPRRTAVPDFFSQFDEFIRESSTKKAWSDSTRSRMKTFRKELFQFDKNLHFGGMDEKALNRFTNYLRGRFSSSTVAKKLEYLRWFLNWATDNNCPVNPAFKTFRPTLKQARNPVVYLNREDLIRLRELKLVSPYLEKARDVFLFCCFSGLRYSDVSNLRCSDIKDDHIEVTTLKTVDSLSIELNKVTRFILDKYKRENTPDGKALPCSSNQAMNRRLKDLCREAGLNEEIRITRYRGNQREDTYFHKWQLVCTHTGRRTFIVQALSMGIPPNVVMKWTGHSSYRAMMPYIDIVDSAKTKSMAKFDKLL